MNLKRGCSLAIPTHDEEMHPQGLNSNNHREEIMIEIILADIALEETKRTEFRTKQGDIAVLIPGS